MQAQNKRYIRAGNEYDHLFPAAMAGTQTIIRNAGVSDTVAFIPKVVLQTLDQTKGIAQELKRGSVYDTCSTIWHFIYDHIAYQKDKEGYEQIRSPARVWKDRKSGVDCDCYSTFISSILTNLGIKHKLRITKYHKDYFQHIYPIVPDGSSYLTMDCVTDQFDKEVPFSEKKDFNMDLQYLNGFNGDDDRGSDYVFSGSNIGALGLFGKKKRKAAEAAEAAKPQDPNAVPASGVKKKKGLKKLFSKINKINPATLILRNGVLAAMKLNMFKVASRLRWAYVSPNEAVKKNINPEKYKKLVAVRQKLENIFYGAGGNPDNLRKAILKGKGNKDKGVAVFGLGYLPLEGVEYLHENMPLSQLLGPEIYHSENVDGMEGFQGFGELGEPITGATIAAATAVISGIAALLKSVGNIFNGGKGQGAEDFNEAAIASAGTNLPTAVENSEPAASAAVSSGSSNVTPNYQVQDSGSDTFTSDINTNAVATANPPALPMVAEAALSTADAASGQPDAGGQPPSFWQKNKKWLLPTVLGVGGIAVIAIGVKLMKSSPAPPAKPLNGPSHKSKKEHKKNKKITAVALL